MLMPDVNVLIYSHRSNELHHAFYRSWMEQMADGNEPFGLSSLVAVAFARIVTNSRYAQPPTPLVQALAEIDGLSASPRCRLLVPGPRHWELTAELCRKTGATGKLVGDAQHAAVALEHGCTWVTRDRDFRSFERAGLRLKLLEPDRGE